MLNLTLNLGLRPFLVVNPLNTTVVNSQSEIRCTTSLCSRCDRALTLGITKGKSMKNARAFNLACEKRETFSIGNVHTKFRTLLKTQVFAGSLEKKLNVVKVFDALKMSRFFKHFRLMLNDFERFETLGRIQIRPGVQVFRGTTTWLPD